MAYVKKFADDRLLIALERISTVAQPCQQRLAKVEKPTPGGHDYTCGNQTID
jgi:hypothetical protein